MKLVTFVGDGVVKVSNMERKFVFPVSRTWPESQFDLVYRHIWRQHDFRIKLVATRSDARPSQRVPPVRTVSNLRELAASFLLTPELF